MDCTKVTGPLLSTSHTLSLGYQTLLGFLLHVIYLLLILKSAVWLSRLHMKPKCLTAYWTNSLRYLPESSSSIQNVWTLNWLIMGLFCPSLTSLWPPGVLYHCWHHHMPKLEICHLCPFSFYFCPYLINHPDLSILSHIAPIFKSLLSDLEVTHLWSWSCIHLIHFLPCSQSDLTEAQNRSSLHPCLKFLTHPHHFEDKNPNSLLWFARPSMLLLRLPLPAYHVTLFSLHCMLQACWTTAVFRLITVSPWLLDHDIYYSTAWNVPYVHPPFVCPVPIHPKLSPHPKLSYMAYMYLHFVLNPIKGEKGTSQTQNTLGYMKSLSLRSIIQLPPLVLNTDPSNFQL